MKSIFLSAGHSNADPGAVGFGRREADIAVEFRNIVGYYLDQEGVPYGCDGKTTVNMPLKHAAAKARDFDIPVEFHCNAAASPKASGCEVLSGPEDAGLAAKLSAALAAAFGIPNRGAKPEAAGQHHRLAFVRSGGLIVELFFISNKSDLAAYDAKKWLAAKAVAKTLITAARP